MLRLGSLVSALESRQRGDVVAVVKLRLPKQVIRESFPFGVMKRSGVACSAFAIRDRATVLAGRDAGLCGFEKHGHEKVLRPGQKMPLKFTIENDGDADAKLDEPDTYLEGLEIRDPDDRVVKVTGKIRGITRRSVPVEAGGFFGRTADISSVLSVPEAKEGFYKIRWSFGDATSNEIRIFVPLTRRARAFV